MGGVGFRGFGAGGGFGFGGLRARVDGGGRRGRFEALFDGFVLLAERPEEVVLVGWMEGGELGELGVGRGEVRVEDAGWTSVNLRAG